MIPLLLLSGLVFLGLPGLGAMKVGHPAHWARWSLSILVIGFLLFEAGLVLWTAPAALDLIGATDLALLCRRMLGGLAPGGWPAGMAAGGAAVVLAVLFARSAWRVRVTQRKLRVNPLLGSHRPQSDLDLVVLPVSDVIAYTTGGRRPQIVVSSGLVEAVGSTGVQAVCAHESVHLRYRHDRYLMVLTGIGAAFRWYPLVARGDAMIRLALERWADEEAGQFHQHGRPGIKKALIAAAFAEVAPEAMAFGSAETVASRVRALDGPPPSSSPGVVAIGYATVWLATLAAAGSLSLATSMSVLAVTNPGMCVL